MKAHEQWEQYKAANSLLGDRVKRSVRRDRKDTAINRPSPMPAVSDSWARDASQYKRLNHLAAAAAAHHAKDLAADRATMDRFNPDMLNAVVNEEITGQIGAAGIEAAGIHLAGQFEQLS